jgi:hypothetical protein
VEYGSLLGGNVLKDEIFEVYKYFRCVYLVQLVMEKYAV